MEVYGALGGVGALAAFGFGLSAVLAASGRPLAPILGSTSVAARERTGRLAWRLRNGVRWARPASRWLLRRPGLDDLAKEAVRVARSRGFSASEESLLSVFVAWAGALAAALSLATSSWACGAAVLACLCAMLAARLRAVRDKRRDAVRESVPDALQSMGACFQSGLSLMQTFQQVANESKGPLKELFERAAGRMEAGRGAHEALETLRSGASVPELAFVAVALDVQHQTGGSMRQVLDAARDMVEGELDLKRSLRVQTAQAKLSARVVSVMPFALIAVFSLVSEGFLEPFFGSPLGVALLALALGMQAAGVLAVRRMLAVEVD